ncbi:MAG: alginate export family protein [Gemmataceae bacterium]|nr:alginate export family protein [Gemmataceae bacterium]
MAWPRLTGVFGFFWLCAHATLADDVAVVPPAVRFPADIPAVAPKAVPTLAFEGVVPPAVPFPSDVIPGSASLTTNALPSESASVAVPAPPKKEDVAADDGCGFNFKKYPLVRKNPPSGNFPVPPTGPGYYSLRDQLSGIYREAPPKSAWPPFALMSPSFYDADFRFLDDPKYSSDDPLDRLHRIRVGENFLFSTGGQIWWRRQEERNSRLSNRDNTYDLMRTRVYADVLYRDAVRVYAELIDARIYDPELPPLLVDRNGADILNLFVDFRLYKNDEGATYGRVGRQELLLGSQRLVSPIEWSNTRRTFDGVRVFHNSEKFSLDAFWLRPVIQTVNKMDASDVNQNFYGAWGTYRPTQKQSIDLYYLLLENANKTSGAGLRTGPSTTHTVGSRYFGELNSWLWDFEGGYQWGELAGADISAAFATAGVGRNFKSMPWNPTFWLYYDYASGDHSPNARGYQTFNQLFAFGHYYLGWADLIGRRNINDANVHLYLYPTKWLTFNTQYHHLWLDSSSDALYNIAGAPYRRSAGARAGGVVGDEIDFYLNFHLSKHSDFLIGYSKLFAGDFIRNTSAPNAQTDASNLYMMYNFRW